MISLADFAEALARAKSFVMAAGEASRPMISPLNVQVY